MFEISTAMVLGDDVIRETLPIVVFRYRARFGHFLRAEASISALTYPVPPRTALLGMIGAVLGLQKDTPQIELVESRIAVCGQVPQTHWHRVKLRKSLPSLLDMKIKRGAKTSSTADEGATLNKQEWLFNPDYEISVSLPGSYHREFTDRLKARRWHYQPCMGLSEMTATLDFISDGAANSLPPQSSVLCESVVRRTENTSLEGRRTMESQTPLAILPIRMPREVTQERVFSHEDYLLERFGRGIPVVSDSCWKLDAGSVQKTVIFL